MTHWIVAPIVLPALLGAFMVLVSRREDALQRILSLAGSAAFLAIALGLFAATLDGTVLVYQLGFWPAPYGISLVVDRLSASMLLLAGVLFPPVILYVMGSGWDLKGRHFHALVQFQIMSIAGAFLTGDLFNLFVFFEVLLIASYGLMIHGGGAARMRAAAQYVLYNLLGSTLFLFALGTLYAVTGSLNIADLAGRVSEIGTADSAGIRVAAVLLLLVFLVKAAILPLQFWLPSTYAEAPMPSAAIFAILTKVGAYAVIRVFTLIFPPDIEIMQGLHGDWLLPAALASTVIGMLGVLAAGRLDRQVAFAVVGSMGMVMTAIALFTEAGTVAALYYIVSSTLATAALFLLADMVREGRPQHGFALRAEAPIAGAPLIAGFFFFAAIAMIGLPPFSGFVGKLLILNAAQDASLAVPWVFAVILGASLLAVTGFSRSGSTIFWKAAEVHAEQASEDEPEEEQSEKGRRISGLNAPTTQSVAVGMLLGLIALYTIFAGPATAHFEATVAQLYDGSAYIEAVLGAPGKQIEYDGGSH